MIEKLTETQRGALDARAPWALRIIDAQAAVIERVRAALDPQNGWRDLPARISGAYEALAAAPEPTLGHPGADEVFAQLQARRAEQTVPECNCYLSNGAHRSDCPQWRTADERLKFSPAAEAHLDRLERAGALAAAPEATAPDYGVDHKLLVDWINSLPEPFRGFVVALETNADPSGNIRDAVCQRENALALVTKLAAANARVAELERTVKVIEKMIDENVEHIARVEQESSEFYSAGLRQAEELDAANARADAAEFAVRQMQVALSRAEAEAFAQKSRADAAERDAKLAWDTHASASVQLQAAQAEAERNREEMARRFDLLARAESEAASLRAEVKRLREDATEVIKPALDSRAAERDQALCQLAAANALLGRALVTLTALHWGQPGCQPTEDIRAHLSGQAPAPTEREAAAYPGDWSDLKLANDLKAPLLSEREAAERAVLEASSKVKLEGEDLWPVMQAELARREAAK